MTKMKFLISSLILLTWTEIWAREVTDTLESTKRDRVIITYDVSQNNGIVVIRFLDAYKRLGRTFRDKYDKLDEVAVVFFDRIGNYEDDMEFTGINADAFMVPGNARYKDSSDGYFLLQKNENPTITLELKSPEPTKLSIPIFLAHYEKKRRYKIFANCGTLVVNLTKKSAANRMGEIASELTTQTITTQEEVEGAFTDVDEANILINKVSDLLNDQDEYPFSDELKQAISSLRDRSYRITDNQVTSRIEEVLKACKQKEEELKGAANAAAKAAEEAAMQQAKKAEQEALARQDSIAAVAQQKAEEDKKRNMWMIIGGVVLAILVFAGNQAFQHFRNVKNQKNMMEMQENIVKQAENEAKRRARSMAQSQVSHIKGDVRKNTRNVIKDSVGRIGKGNKGVSI